ncbi:hypothetical protein OIU85_018223 [Salix viminalis]|uniref:Alliinase EGF-like domain-containing protein n=1 Tax=Salix viminalis TaxID=40686 RepID=A0A9Q0UTY3_SALVM|nr:hypothetical protein OIU85_018223 [Salix viminalis]
MEIPSGNSANDTTIWCFWPPMKGKNGYFTEPEKRRLWRQYHAQDTEEPTLDGLVLDENKEPVCECNTCYGGPDCSQFLPDCAADANGYVPFFFYFSLGHVKYYISGYDGRGRFLKIH